MSKETDVIMLSMDKYIESRGDKEPGTIYISKLQFRAMENQYKKAGTKKFIPRYKGYEIKST